MSGWRSSLAFHPIESIIMCPAMYMQPDLQRRQPDQRRCDATDAQLMQAVLICIPGASSSYAEARAGAPLVGWGRCLRVGHDSQVIYLLCIRRRVCSCDCARLPLLQRAVVLATPI